MTLPTPDQLRERLSYDPVTGGLTWRPYSDPAAWQIGWNARYAGKPAFAHMSKRGYLNGSWKPHTLTAHRVAWAVHHGEWPTHQIDHINGDRTDNRIANLRDVPNAENAKNMRPKSTNTSGVTGVFFAKHVQKWTAQIRHGGRTRHLGLFSEKREAVAARRIAERQHGFHENHGKAL